MEMFKHLFKKEDSNPDNLSIPKSDLDIFSDNLYDLEKSNCSRDFGEYLLAFYHLIHIHKNEELSYFLFYNLLKQAYASDVTNSPEEWLQFTNPPDIELIIQNNFDDKGFEILCDVLKFQISELHQMNVTPPTPDERMYGYVSTSGNKWVNFHQIFNLRCGIRCMTANSICFNEANWSFLALAFEFGRRYE